MKNIKTVCSKAAKILSAFAMGVGVFVILCFPVYLAALWISSGYNPDFLKIDSCLDRGGRWNYEVRECEFSIPEE